MKMRDDGVQRSRFFTPRAVEAPAEGARPCSRTAGATC